MQLDSVDASTPCLQAGNTATLFGKKKRARIANISFIAKQQALDLEIAALLKLIRRLRTWLRASMTANSLGALALMHIRYAQKIDCEKAVEMFLNLHSRKNTSLNLILQSIMMKKQEQKTWSFIVVIQKIQINKDKG